MIICTKGISILRKNNMEQESTSSFSPLVDIEPGSIENSDDDELSVKQSKKRSLTKTTAKKTKKRHFNKNAINTTLPLEVSSDENSNGRDYNYVSNDDYDYTTNPTNQYDNGHVINEHDNGHKTNEHDNRYVTNKHDNEHVTNVINECNNDYENSSISKNGSGMNQPTKPNLKDLQLIPIDKVPGKSWIWSYYQLYKPVQPYKRIVSCSFKVNGINGFNCVAI